MSSDSVAEERIQQIVVPNLNAQEAAQRRQEALQKLEQEADEFNTDSNGLVGHGGQDSNSQYNGGEDQDTDTSRYFVQPDDFVYQDLPGEAAPIVIEKYKLIFFTVPKVGCTIWKMLFRRMAGFDNWKEHVLGLPHSPQKNGLKYLFHYNISYASEIMTSPEWTRAIFVRDPKERFLSAYLDKAVEEGLFLDTCCNRLRQIYCKPEPPAMHEFLKAIHTCHDSHWDPQTDRMEDKYWPYINFFGSLENVEDDAKRLLQQLGAWDEYGSNGWDENGDTPIFHSANKDGLKHAKNAKDKLHDFLYPEIEQEIEEFYDKDYKHPMFNFSHSEHFKESTAREPINYKALDRPFVEPRDYIFRRDLNNLQGESSPIILEDYKLAFFAIPHVARVEFKRLFHRMMGHADWKTRKVGKKKQSAMDEGLKFLHEYNLTKASEIMTSPEWTRAIFLRDPKERFVIAYTETATINRILLHKICCRHPRVFCIKGSTSSTKALLEVPDITEFVTGIEKCKSTHWDPFVERMAAMTKPSINPYQKKVYQEHSFDNGKYWKYINFIGHMDNAYKDAKTLLEGIGAWEQFGKTGWSSTPNDQGTQYDAFFRTREFMAQEIKYKELVRKFIKKPDLEKKIDSFYEADYNSRWLNLTRKIIIPTSINDLQNAAQDIRFVLNKDKEVQDTKLVQRQW